MKKVIRHYAVVPLLIKKHAGLLKACSILLLELQSRKTLTTVVFVGVFSFLVVLPLLFRARICNVHLFLVKMVARHLVFSALIKNQQQQNSKKACIRLTAQLLSVRTRTPGGQRALKETRNNPVLVRNVYGQLRSNSACVTLEFLN